MLTLDDARVWYDEHDIVHGYAHIKRVYQMALRLAQSEKADVEIVRTAALLHDIQGSGPFHIARKKHHLYAAEFAVGVLQKEGWNNERIDAVCHCIRAHRYRDEREKPETIEARVLFDADKLDAIGATGVMRALIYAVNLQNPVYEEPSSQFLETRKLEEGEHYSAYHEYLFKLRNIRDVLFTSSARQIAEKRVEIMNDYFVVLAAEMRGLR